MSTVTRPLESTRVRFAHGPGFWVIAAAFLTTMAFSTIPTPLYAIYQQRDGFPTYVITVIFASYAVGVMASLYLAGHVSDWLGRRRVALLAVLAEAVVGGGLPALAGRARAAARAVHLRGRRRGSDGDRDRASVRVAAGRASGGGPEPVRADLEHGEPRWARFRSARGWTARAVRVVSARAPVRDLPGAVAAQCAGDRAGAGDGGAARGAAGVPAAAGGASVVREAVVLRFGDRCVRGVRDLRAVHFVGADVPGRDVCITRRGCSRVW